MRHPVHNIIDIVSFSDLLALPQYSGGGGGAMEIWGLVIAHYREFLAKNNEATSDELAAVAEVTAHELAHQVLR